MAEPLMMQDLENIDLFGLTVQRIEGGYMIFDVCTFPDIFRKDDYVVPIDEILQGSNFLTEEGIWGYIDGLPSEELPVALQMTTDLIADIRKGDYMTFTYDNGQILNVYLPEIYGHVYDWFFIAKDGSTYYDPELTQIAGEVPETPPIKKFPSWILLFAPLLLIPLLKKKFK